MSELNIANLQPGTDAYNNASEEVQYLSGFLIQELHVTDPVERACSFEDVLIMVKQYAPEKFEEMLGYSDRLGVWTVSSSSSGFARISRQVSNLRNRALEYSSELEINEDTKTAVEQVVDIYRDRVKILQLNADSNNN